MYGIFTYISHKKSTILVGKYTNVVPWIRHGYLPSGKQTWQWKMNLLKIFFPIEMGIFPPAMLVYQSVNWLVVSTHLKNISQNGNLLQIGVKIKNL